MANQTEIENALQWVFGDDDSEQEKKAVVWGQLFEHFKMSPEGWKYCVMKLFESRNEKLLFFYLQIIQETITHKYEGLEDGDKFQLRSAILTFLQQRLCVDQHTPFILNKFAQLVALLFRADYLTTWTGFFDDLLNLINVCGGQNTLLVDMYLRIMSSIDQEVVSLEVARPKDEFVRNSQIKDRMRDQSLPAIVDSWYSLIVLFAPTNPKIARHVFEVLNCYIGWIDINLVVNERFMQLFSSLIHNTPLREVVIDYFAQVVSKGMRDVDKLNLVSTLNLTLFVESIPISNDEQDVDFQTSVAKLVGQCGLEISEVLTNLPTNPQPNTLEAELRQHGESLLQSFLVLAFKFMSHPDDGVSEETIQFLQKYVNQIKKNKTMNEVQQEQFRVLLLIIKNKISLDDQFDFDRMLEYESQTLEFRKNLFTLFKTIAFIHPQLAAQMVQSFIDDIPQQDPFALEGTLQLFYLLGEGVSVEVQSQTQQFFINGMEIFCKLNIPFHPHRFVVVSFYDNLLRYSKFFAGRSEAIEGFLRILLDGRSIRSDVRIIRTKSCEALVKFLRALPSEVVPFAALIVEGIKGYILDGQRQNSYDYDTTNLVEAAGIVVAKVGPGTETQAQLMELFLSNPIAQLEQMVNQKLYKHDTQADQKYSKYMCDLVTTVGTFSKGFQAQSENPNTLHYFCRPLLLLLQVTKEQPHFGIRSKAIFFLHRMVEVLGIGVLQTFVQSIEILMNGSDLTSVNEVIALVNQVISTFKENSFDIINQLFLPMVTFIFQIISQNENVTKNSEEEREVLALRRNYFLFMHTIVISKLENILVSQANLPHFENILNTLREGGLFYADPHIQQKCFACFRRLVAQWGDANPPFTQYFFEKIVPLIFEVPMNPAFNLTDALTVSVLSEQCFMLHEASKKYPQALPAFLAQNVFPALNCPAEFTATFLGALANPQALKQFLRAFFLDCKSRMNVGG